MTEQTAGPVLVRLLIVWLFALAVARIADRSVRVEPMREDRVLIGSTDSRFAVYHLPDGSRTAEVLR